MHFRNRLIRQYSWLNFFSYIAIVGGLVGGVPLQSSAADLSGEVGMHYMPTKKAIKQHVQWTKIVISGNSGEKTVNIENEKHSFSVQNIGQTEGMTVAWVWQLPENSSGDKVTHGLFPLQVTDVSGRVGFTFYDLGSIHKKIVKKVERQTQRKEFSKANDQFELANEFYEKLRELESGKWLKQANSWNYGLYQAGFNQANQVGLRRSDQREKERVRIWLKEWIRLCMKQESLRPRLAGALQSWSKFSKLAYSRVADWPDTMPQDITDEKLEKIFLKGEFRDWMIEDMVWLQDTVFGNQSIRLFVEERPQLSALVHKSGGLGTSLSLFAQAITDFAREWK